MAAVSRVQEFDGRSRVCEIVKAAGQGFEGRPSRSFGIEPRTLLSTLCTVFCIEFGHE